MREFANQYLSRNKAVIHWSDIFDLKYLHPLVRYSDRPAVEAGLAMLIRFAPRKTKEIWAKQALEWCPSLSLHQILALG